MNVNITFGGQSGGNVNAVCPQGHLLQLAYGRNAMCNECKVTGLNPSWACYCCDYDNCNYCAMDSSKVDDEYTYYDKNQGQSYSGPSQTVPYGNSLKFYDRNHKTHMFIGNQDTDHDHQVYGCKQSGFGVENFDRRTGYTITPTNDGFYQIMDNDHQAFLFIGNGVDEGGDHIAWACPQSFWKDYNDFMHRTSWSLLPGQGGWRFFDKKHNSYLFLGNSNDGGDHTLYSVPAEKYNNNPQEWMRRTVFDIQGFIPPIPANKTVKFLDANHGTHVFVGHGDTDNDHQVYGCVQSGFGIENFQPRTSITITQLQTGDYQIMDNDHQTFLFVGNGVDEGGDHTLWSCAQQYWKDYNDFLNRTSWQILPAEGGCYRFLDRKHNSYLFVGNSNDGGDHTLYSVPSDKFKNNPNEWIRRTLFVIQ
ncbi:MAG: hypothetical protein GY853_09355 [PVC group bacterium]|nr:hypothetical protein [PVC group bacterium]